MNLPTASDIASFLISFSWSTLGLPFIAIAWRAFRTPFPDTSAETSFPIRCAFVSVSLFVYVMMFAALANLVREQFGPSCYGVRALSAGSLAGVIFLVWSIRASRHAGRREAK